VWLTWPEAFWPAARPWFWARLWRKELFSPLGVGCFEWDNSHGKSRSRDRGKVGSRISRMSLVSVNP